MKYMLVMLILLIGSAAGNITVSGDDAHGNIVESQVTWGVEWLPIPGVNVSMVCEPNPAMWSSNCTCNVSNTGNSTLYNVTATDNSLGAIPVPNQLAPGQSGQATITVLRPEGNEMTDLEYQAIATADDGWYTTEFDILNNEGGFIAGYLYDSASIHGFARWAVTIPAGAVVTSAKIKIYATTGPGNSVGSPSLTIAFDDQASPGQITSATDGAGRTRTSATVAWQPVIAADGWIESPEIKTVIQELIDSHGAYSSRAMQCLIDDAYGSGDNAVVAHDYDSSATYAPKLLISYTVASGSPMYAYAQLQ